MTATYGGIHDELARMTTRNRRRFLPDAEEVTPEELDVKVASPMLLDVPSSNRLEAARRYARELLRLQSAFASFYGLAWHDRATHRAEVCYRIAVPLLRGARTFADRPTNRLARRLLWEGRALGGLVRARGNLPEEIAALGREARRERAAR